MWILFYLAFNSGIGAMANFKSHDDCEKFRLELARKIPMRGTACIAFDPAPPIPIEPPHHDHDEHHDH